MEPHVARLMQNRPMNGLASLSVQAAPRVPRRALALVFHLCSIVALILLRSCSKGVPKLLRNSPPPSYEMEQNGTKRNTFFRREANLYLITYCRRLLLGAARSSEMPPDAGMNRWRRPIPVMKSPALIVAVWTMHIAFANIRGVGSG